MWRADDTCGRPSIIEKTIGIIAGFLFAQGHLGTTFYVPLWVIPNFQAAMALGTLLGGWRIVRTNGSKITQLTPEQGWCAQLSMRVPDGSRRIWRTAIPAVLAHA